MAEVFTQGSWLNLGFIAAGLGVSGNEFLP